MWETYGLENPDLLWAGMALRGGIAGQQQAACGALSSAAVCLGLRHISPLDDEEQSDKSREIVYEKARKLADSFLEKYGAVSCIDLVGVEKAAIGPGRDHPAVPTR